MMKSRPDGGNATDKVLAVLQALGEHERLADIAAATGLARSTVHRILQSLVEHRFAIGTGDGRYIGGPVVLTLAGRLMGRFDPAEHADGALRRLRDDTGYTVHLGLLAGDDVVYGAKMEGAKPYRMPSRVGMSVRLHSTGIGKAILAALPEATVRAIVQRTGLEPRTPNTISDEAATGAASGAGARAGVRDRRRGERAGGPVRGRCGVRPYGAGDRGGERLHAGAGAVERAAGALGGAGRGGGGGDLGVAGGSGSFGGFGGSRGSGRIRLLIS